MPMRGELSIPAPQVVNSLGEATGWQRFMATVTEPDAITAAGVFALGLAITLLLIHFSPSHAEMLGAIDLYP